MKTLENQLPIPRLILYHFYAGILITAFYIWLSPHVIAAGLPGLSVLLMAELFVLTPVVGGHLLWLGRRVNGRYSLKNIVLFRRSMPWKQFTLWVLGGMVVSVIIYIPLYPLGLHLRATIFSWLPEWYFNPSFGTDNTQLIAQMFLLAILIDGFVGPIVEELFFRGYLLPRMAYLKSWAPILNGVMFGLYHFWQPHNLIAVCAMGVILSWIVWKTKNVYLGIAIHCAMNVLGAIGGYLAVSGGVMIGR